MLIKDLNRVKKAEWFGIATPDRGRFPMGATFSLLVAMLLWGLKARADPSGVAPIFRCNPYGQSVNIYGTHCNCDRTYCRH